MVEYLAVITSFICVYYNIKEKWQAWIWSIVACLLYAYVMYESKSWANFGLQFCFILISFYGLYEWLWKKNIHQKKEIIQISSLIVPQILILLGINIIFVVIMVFLSFSYVTNLDISTTFLSLIGQYLLAIKKIETWFFWIIANILYICMFFSLGLYSSMVLYFVFILMAFLGFLRWRKEFLSR